jgi:hypothetical protein
MAKREKNETENSREQRLECVCASWGKALIYSDSNSMKCTEMNCVTRCLELIAAELVPVPTRFSLSHNYENIWRHVIGL